MKIVSPLITDGSEILNKFTCEGQNINPPLQFVDIPHNAKSLVLIMDDPDATNGTFVHWLLYNIDRTTTFLDENQTAGTEGMTSWGNPGYGGPCPPSGTHRYFFKLYALDTVLALADNPTKHIIEEAMEGHVVEQAVLMGTSTKKS